MTIERVFHAVRAGRIPLSGTGVRTLFLAAVMFTIWLCTLTPAQAQTTGEEIRVVKGHSTVLRHEEKIQTVSLADEEVADVVAITADEIVVIGKEIGNTTLIVWGESQRYVSHRIQVDRNFSGQQILLEVMIGEVNRNTLDELGFDWSWQNFDDDFITGGDKHLGLFPGQTQTPAIPLNPGIATSGYYRYVGDLNVISASIRALQERGDYKLRAAPKLLCLSGENAHFLAGGEIPVPVSVTGSGGIQQVGIEWKEYGVRLNFTPKIIDSTLINLKVMPEVSSLDYNNAILLSGFQIPALLTRRAEATVELASGQGLLMGGLLVKEQVEQVRRIPILGHIPLLGALFTRKDAATQDNELMILVAPRLYTTMPAGDLPELPWDGRFEKPKDTTGAQPEYRRDTGDGMGQRPADAGPQNTATVPREPRKPAATDAAPQQTATVADEEPAGATAPVRTMEETTGIADETADTTSAEFKLEPQPRKLWPPSIRPANTEQSADTSGDDE
ncbi:MAG: hypothetical protein Kow0074_16960 [Candidatus Zixiibacteriota bacterium]